MSDEWVELRVHGVSGTPPESMLGTPHVTQVAGDQYSRFFRPAHGPGDHVLEGYHWGRFTSGSWRQSLSLLLVPFGLVNATQFMLPRPRGTTSKVLYVVAGMCLRAVAVVLTYLFAFAISLILIDLIGYRWADRTGFLHLQDRPADLVLQACVLASAAGLLLISLMGLSGRTRQPPDPAAPGEVTGSDLDESFYAVDPNAPTLRWLHVAAGLGVVALLADLARTGEHPGRDADGLRITIWVVLAVITAVVVLLGDPEKSVSVSLAPRRMVERWHGLVRYLAPAAAGVAVVLVVAEVVGLDGVERKRAGTRAAGRLVDFDVVANDLMYAGIAALAVLLVVVGLHLALVARSDQAPAAPLTERDEHFFRPYALGLTPFLLACVAVFLGVGFSAAATTAISSALGLDVDVKGDGTRIKVGTTPMLDRVAYAWGITVGVFAVVGLVLLVRFLLTRSAYLERTRAMYAAPPGETTTLPEGWPGRAATGAFVGQLKNRLPFIATTFAVSGLAIAVVQGYENLSCTHEVAGPGRCSQAPGWLDWLSEPGDGTVSIFLINFGAWVFIAVAGLVVTISRGAFKDTGLRRGINVVWDVFSFWPHAVHPFVPRPYSRWTVIELRNRIRFHLGGRAGEPGPPVDPGRPEVVVCAHSQGTLISFAAILQLTQAERDRIAFLSCGSQLRVIYPRAFPAYVNLPAVQWLHDALGGRWVNLYRVTDPLAGPVLSWDHDEHGSRHFPLTGTGGRSPDDQPVGEDRVRKSGHDWRLIDPIPYDPDCETGPLDGLHGHHNYWLDPAWARALSTLRG